MSKRDASGAALDVLSRYFSPALASTLLTITLRREELPVTHVGTNEAARLVTALERTLPSYLGDASRRQSCLSELKNALQSDDGPAKVQSGVWRTVADIPIRSEADLRIVGDELRALCQRLGLSPLDQTKMLTALSELGRNILQYAGSGKVEIADLTGGRSGIEITAIDFGPGIADLALVLSNHYRSKSGMGVGLKGARRLVDEFEIDSAPGRGTRVTLRKYARR